MRIVCISDTHEHSMSATELPAGDMIIHAGDFTVNGDALEVAEFSQWFADLPYRYKLVIAGNHDLIFEDEPLRARELLDPSITYLEHEAITIEGLRFFGTPYQPYFCNWAFNVRESEQLAAMYRDIPSDTNVLITHCPPLGIQDRAHNGRNAGSRVLRERLQDQSRALYPKLHVFGHIHEAYGRVDIAGTTFVNASITDERTRTDNKAIVIDL